VGATGEREKERVREISLHNIDGKIILKWI
jgi:hypothetical protein